MKCPFRTIEIVDYTMENVDKTTIEYAECCLNECPYWGVLKYTVCGPIDGCRRAEKEVV